MINGSMEIGLTSEMIVLTEAAAISIWKKRDVSFLIYRALSSPHVQAVHPGLKVIYGLVDIGLATDELI